MEGEISKKSVVEGDKLIWKVSWQPEGAQIPLIKMRLEVPLDEGIKELYGKIIEQFVNCLKFSVIGIKPEAGLSILGTQLAAARANAELLSNLLKEKRH